MRKQIQDLIKIGPIGGIDATSQIGLVRPPNVADETNFIPNREYGGFVVARGRMNLFSNTLPYGEPKGMMTYVAGPGAPATYLAVTQNASAQEIWYASVGLPWMLLASPTVPTGYALPAWSSYGRSVTQFVSYGTTVYATNQKDIPVAFTPPTGGSMAAPVGGVTTGQIYRWQNSAPTLAPTMSAGAAGGLNGTYYYRYTYRDSVRGKETSPSPPSAPITVTNQNITIGNLYNPTEPGVDQLLLYRIGGALASQWYLVATLQNAGTYTDALPDANVTGGALVLHRDPPPPFVAVALHRERIFGFGYNGNPQNIPNIPGSGLSDLWWSNYAEPWAFDGTNQVRPIGRSGADDPAVALSSFGSVLAMFKRKSLWILFGDDNSAFRQQKVADVGCASQQSVATEAGVVYWNAGYQGVYSFDGASVANLSDGDEQRGGIRLVLTDLAPEDHAASVGFITDHAYFISFPTTGVTYGFDIERKVWFKLGYAASSVAYDVSMNDVVAGQAGQPLVETWFYAGGDRGGPITATVVSGNITDESDSDAYVLRYLFIDTPPGLLGGTVTATITSYYGDSTIPTTYTRVYQANDPRVRLFDSLPAIVCTEAFLTIRVDATDELAIQTAVVRGYGRRRDVVPG